MLPRHYIFNHIPKTGGTSILAVCRQNLEPTEISPPLAEHQLRLIPTARFEHYKLIAGHFSVLSQSGFCRSRYSLTLLREPIGRIFSLYNFWRSVPEQNPWTSKAKELSFAGFVEFFMDSPVIVHNPYTHHFAAIGRDCPSYPVDANALLAAAKHNLAAFDFVGIFEEFDLSTRLLCHELGWSPPATIPHENRSRLDVGFGEIDRQTTEILQDRNRLDLEMYEFAVQLFNARKAGAGADESTFHRGFEERRFIPFPIPYQTGRRATIHSVSASWIPDESSRTLEIAVSFQVNLQTAKLAWGVQITDAAGNIVWGTNTTNEGLTLNYKMDRECRGAYLVQCELPQGTYFVTVSLAEARRLGFHEHWIDNATSFTVAPSHIARPGYGSGIRLKKFSSVVIGV